MDAAQETYDYFQTGGVKYRSDELSPMLDRLFGCLDLSEVPPATRFSVGGEAAVCLKEVLDRIELPVDEEIPDAAAVKAEGVKRWRIPPTEIEIAQVTEGPRKGDFLFTPATVKRAKEFYHRVEHVPYRPGSTEGLYDWYLSEPGWMIPSSWIRALPTWTRERALGVTIWQWVGLVLILSLGAVTMFLTYRFGWRRAERMRHSNVFRYLLTLWTPVAAMFIPLVIEYFVQEQLIVRGPVLDVLAVSLHLVFLLAAVIVLLGASSRCAELIIASPRIHPGGIDAQLIRLGFRVLGIVATMVVLIEGGRHLGIPVTTLLAGAGVGGLAVALAAQDSLKSLFGSMMIVLDKPYRVGERISAKGYDGFVEEIGLRSTKLRLRSGHAASIPNEEMARIDIENISRRPHIRRTADLHIPLDTPHASLEKALSSIQQILEDHEGMDPELPPRVYFNEFNADSFNIRIIYWYTPPNYWDFLEFSQRVNHEICRAFEEQGVDFSLPTRLTHVDLQNRNPFELHLAGDLPKRNHSEAVE